MRLSLGDPAGCTSARAQHRKWLCSGLAAVLSMTTLAALAAPASATDTMPWGVPMFLSTPWGVDVSGFRLAVVGALRPAGGIRRPFPCGPIQATRAGSW